MIMKKQLFLFVMILLPMVASAHDIEVKNADGVTIYYNYINNGTELEVTRRGSSHNSYTGNVVIPNEVTYMNRTRKVTSIGNCAFSSCSALTSVTIPNNVTNIGRDAFRDGSSEECPSLASIVVESGNPIYDSRDNCNAIVETKNNILRFGCKNTIIPNSVTYIGSYAFRGCSKLTSINIPNSVTGINICAFEDCTALTSIVIPNSVTSLSESVFSGCSSLTSVTIPNSVAYIASDTFYNCI